jgi:hypothetical protein
MNDPSWLLSLASDAIPAETSTLGCEHESGRPYRCVSAAALLLLHCGLYLRACLSRTPRVRGVLMLDSAGQRHPRSTRYAHALAAGVWGEVRTHASDAERHLRRLP